MSEYSFASALSRAGISDYVDLFAQAFPGDAKLNATYLNWLYAQNPDGEVIGVDAFLNGQLAAHYAILPRRYVFKGEVYRAALSINTATHPDHQGKGLFTKLAHATYELAASRGVRFVIGAANANSVGGFTRKLGFSNLGQVRLYAGLEALETAPDDLSLLTDDEAWLGWRLGNPSRRYSVRNLGDDVWTVSTTIRRIPFHLGRIKTPRIVAGGNPRMVPEIGFSPAFASTLPHSLKLPLKLQPSPWHVIWRALDTDLPSDLSTRLRMDGLAMDTF